VSGVGAQRVARADVLDLGSRRDVAGRGDAIDEIAAEATGLLAFVAPDSAERRVEFVPSP
jgi:hypothetical protein